MHECSSSCKQMYHIHARALGGQKTASDPLELELWVVVSWELNPGPLTEK